MRRRYSPLAENRFTVVGSAYMYYTALNQHRLEITREVVTRFTTQDFQTTLALALHYFLFLN